MNVNLKKLRPEAKAPEYATQGAAGFDLVAIENVTIEPGDTALVKTGLSIEIPRGYEMQVRPRSGTSLKTKLIVPNSPGTIDSDYRGEICVIMRNTAERDVPGNTYTIKKGDRIAQGVICPIVQAQFVVVEELSDSDRGSGGFGSTGK